MLRKETRDRLRRLHRHRSSQVTGPAKSAVSTTFTPPPSSLPSPVASPLAAGREVATDAGTHWLVHRSLHEIWPAAGQHITAWQSLPPRPAPAPKQATPSQRKQHRDYEAYRAGFPEHCVFLDLETCGLAGSTIFLAGLLHFEGRDRGEWVLSQFWARNYAEERAMLESVKSCLINRQVLITFNGKSFDWPQVRDRCTLHAGTADCGLPELVHLDLLHLARQRWKSVLPDCKLQTLERFICGRHRTGDIPGREIPAAYDDYVRSRTNHARQQMDSVLHHNALDLITLLEVAMRWDDRTTAIRCA